MWLSISVRQQHKKANILVNLKNQIDNTIFPKNNNKKRNLILSSSQVVILRFLSPPQIKEVKWDFMISKALTFKKEFIFWEIKSLISTLSDTRALHMAQQTSITGKLTTNAWQGRENSFIFFCSVLFLSLLFCSQVCFISPTKEENRDLLNN